ncbi:MAG: GTPase HflX [Chlamydiia bacterium]|nr:GTPase HflX [Chlamydiia bacterium]MCH9617927.1 GTPase HflX [Chlamydiia bacterium]MCH9624143.1 GTPase HflX [Chlamydiia bacterium]
MSDIEKIEQQDRATFESIKKALLVGVHMSGGESELCREHLKELGELAKTLGVKEVREIYCPVKKFNAPTYIGSGKVEEFRDIVAAEGIDVIIFDDSITPNQQKNIENVAKVPVIDRTEVILEIFGLHARTKEAMLQIEVAKIRHQLPRLKRMWTHLSRQRGASGGGSSRGTGEKQIEIDRRLLKHKLRSVEREIKDVVRGREQTRKGRLRSGVPTFSIVGYTNAGKSTLLNALTGSEVLVEDKLFATLDTTARAYQLPNRSKIVLVDTVGFIRKLPHSLVKAFRSTLEEVCYTDVLIHLLDCSKKGSMARFEATMQVLEELGIKDKPVIVVLNKIDLLKSKEHIRKFNVLYDNVIAVSAVTHEGFDDLLSALEIEASRFCKKMHLRIDQSNYKLIDEITREGRVIHTDYEGNDVLLEVALPEHMERKAKPFLVE